MVEFAKILGGEAQTTTRQAGAALSGKATRAALYRYATGAMGIVFGGLVLAAVAGSLSSRAGGVGILISAVGVLCLCNAARIWWYLRRHPWQAWECRFRVVPGFGNGSPTLVLTGPGDAEFVLGVVSFKWRWRELNACDRAEVWMAGNPARGGVVSPPGGAHLLWARRPLSARRRESLRRATVGVRPGDRHKNVEVSAAQLDQPG